MFKSSMRNTIFLSLAAGAFFINQGQAFACPMCKEALARMGDVWTAIGFNWSIYLMIAMPFILLGAFTSVLYIQYRKHEHRNE